MAQRENVKYSVVFFLSLNIQFKIESIVLCSAHNAW